MKIFVDKLEAIVKDFYEEFKDSKPMEDVEIANEALQRETICWFCRKDLEDDRVRDHDPYTGKFRGIAHNKCNLNAKKSFSIPIIVHNLNYDEGLFFRDLVGKFGFTKIIPKNTENFISFSKFFKVDTKKVKDDKEKGVYVELRFLDSFRFMGMSLEKLVDCVKREDLKSLKEEFGDKFDLVCKKGLIPYSYLTSMDRLREREFPPLEEFLKNDLQYKNPKREDYEFEGTFLRSKRVWDEYVETVKEKYNNTKEIWIRFRCKRLDDLLAIYQKMDVLQLNDVFTVFRDETLENFGLEPLHFYTTPSLAWEGVFKESGAEVELFTENQKEMSLDIENCIRGGVANAPTRYSEANNIYLEDYDPTKESKFIMSDDINSLYSGVMTKYPLPCGGYEYMEKEDLEDWEKFTFQEGKGCWLWVDLEYPPELHDDHNELPLAPEKINGKLVPNLNDIKEYGLHYIVLEHYLKWGLKIKKIYRGIKFNESFWMKPFVEKNIELRKKAKKERNEFNEMLFKLFPNSSYGKAIQNNRDKANIEVCQGWNFDKLVRRVNFKDRTILDYNKSLAHFRQTTVKMDKPKIVGASILD